MAWQASVVAAARQGLFLIPVVFILPNLLGLAGVEYAQPAADLLAFALALPMGLSVLKNRNMEEKYVSTCFTFYRRSAVPD